MHRRRRRRTVRQTDVPRGRRRRTEEKPLTTPRRLRHHATTTRGRCGDVFARAQLPFCPRGKMRIRIMFMFCGGLFFFIFILRAALRRRAAEIVCDEIAVVIAKSRANAPRFARVLRVIFRGLKSTTTRRAAVGVSRTKGYECVRIGQTVF